MVNTFSLRTLLVGIARAISWNHCDTTTTSNPPVSLVGGEYGKVRERDRERTIAEILRRKGVKGMAEMGGILWKGEKEGFEWVGVRRRVRSGRCEGGVKVRGDGCGY